SAPIRVVASRSHRDSETDRFLATLGDCEIVSAGSSLKFCLVASGGAGLYPRVGRTIGWGTAAGHAGLAAAGGSGQSPRGAARRSLQERNPAPSPTPLPPPRPTRRREVNPF